MATRTDSPLGRRNPVCKLAAVLLLTLGVFAAIDPVTAGVVLIAELPLIALTGVGIGATIRRLRPALIAAVIVGVVNAAFGTVHTGHTLLDAGPIQLSTSGLIAGLGISLRVMAIAVPGVLAMACTDPTDLADSLIQQLKAPPRFAIGALAALRLVSLIGAEWETIRLARRARGVDAGGSPLAAIRLLCSGLFIVLVGAIRRGTRLAAAMDSRGFAAGLPRSCARRARIDRVDLGLPVLALVVAVSANLISIAAGTWNPLLR